MKRTLISAVGLFVCAAALAQNLNPTLEVTNIYAREASGIEKPSQLLEVPDSVLHFNLDFDYAVNETPYQGAYEFKPYLVQLRPQARPSKEGKLFLRGGAGYGLHPELTAVYTPVRTGKYHVNLYGDHHSYIGDYHNIVLDADGVFSPDGTSRKGRDLRSTVGADARVDWSRGILTADVQYRHMQATTLALENPSVHRVQASAHVQNLPGTTQADYDLTARLYALWSPEGGRELYSRTDGKLGAKFFGHYFRMGLQVETVSGQEGGLSCFHITLPRYVRSGKRYSLAAGFKAAFILRSDASFYPRRAGHIFPDVQASWTAIPENLVLYAAVTGGNDLITKDFLLSQNPFQMGFSGSNDVQIQRILAAVGARGSIAGRFSYDVKGGYSWLDNIWLWGLDAFNDQPAVCYASTVHTVFVKADALWKNDFLDIAGHFTYVKTLNKPSGVTAGFVPFGRPLYRGDAHAFYNWGERIRAGVTADFRSPLNSAAGKLPGYCDLGLEGTFQMTPALGFWCKLGNVLNQAIQRVPCYAEKGMYFSVGASLSL